MRFENIIFDFDGVIVDSEPVHARAKKRTLDHYSINYDEHIFDRFKGIPDTDFFKYVSEELTKGKVTAKEMHDLKKMHYASLFPEVKLIDGALAFIQMVRETGIHTAIASSTTSRDFHLINEKYQLGKYFDVMVTGDDTVKHKPHPEPYIKAIALLQTTPNLCIAIEDSPNGIKSARDSGCTVVGLTSSFNQFELKEAGADFIIESFDEFYRVCVNC